MTARTTLAQLIQLAVRGILTEVRTTLPGTVVAYNRLTQRVDVQPNIMDGYTDEGGFKTKLPPVCGDVPVAFTGAGDYWQSYPLTKGDTVTLVFCSSCISIWKARGGNVDPKDYRHHHIADAIAIAGPRDAKHAISGIPESAWVINVPDGAQVRLGSPSASKKLLNEDFVTALTTALSAPDATGALATLKAALMALPGWPDAYMTDKTRAS